MWESVKLKRYCVFQQFPKTRVYFQIYLAIFSIVSRLSKDTDSKGYDVNVSKQKMPRKCQKSRISSKWPVHLSISQKSAFLRKNICALFRLLRHFKKDFELFRLLWHSKKKSRTYFRVRNSVGWNDRLRVAFTRLATISPRRDFLICEVHTCNEILRKIFWFVYVQPICVKCMCGCLYAGERVWTTLLITLRCDESESRNLQHLRRY